MIGVALGSGIDDRYLSVDGNIREFIFAKAVTQSGDIHDH